MAEYGNPKKNPEKAPLFSSSNIQYYFIITACGVVIVAGIVFISNFSVIANVKLEKCKEIYNSLGVEF